MSVQLHNVVFHSCFFWTEISAEFLPLKLETTLSPFTAFIIHKINSFAAIRYITENSMLHYSIFVARK